MNFEELILRLKKKTKYQNTPIAATITDDDYEQLVLNGIKTLYIDLNHESDFEKDVDENVGTINTPLTISKIEYILNSATIGFYELIQSTVNTLHGYSTDALSITNADKPYANISNEISRLENRQIELFHKIRASEG